MPDRIIVPLDGSSLSHVALPLARGLATKLRCPVTLVTVSESSDETSGQNLSEVAGTFEGTQVDEAVQTGQPAEGILEVAKTYSDPVIVMASHGRSGLGRALIGSVASSVVQGATYPVFVVRSSENAAEEHGTKNIEHAVVPLDGSLLAERSLAAVDRLFGNSVRLYLVRFMDPYDPGQAYAPEPVGEHELSTHESAEDYMKKIVAQLEDEGKTVAWDTRPGPPDQGINELANQIDADLIAMTTHGQSGVGRVLLGSVTERVLGNAERPLMIVRASHARDQEIEPEDPLIV